MKALVAAEWSHPAGADRRGETRWRLERDAAGPRRPCAGATATKQIGPVSGAARNTNRQR